MAEKVRHSALKSRGGILKTMANLRIPRGQTVTLDLVDGELTVGNNATIEARDGKKIIVTKGVYLEGKTYVNGDLECELLQSKVFLSKLKQANLGSNRARLELTGRYSGQLEVKGNLIVHKQLNISHIVKVTGAINAKDIDIGGKIQADAIKCEQMRVGGRAEIQNEFEASSVDVGGKVLALGTVKLGDLHVGGEAEVGGGFITGNIRVGGKFISRSSLEFGELLVYGRGFLPAGCKGRGVSTFGKLEIDGNITCDYFEVAGFIAVNGDCNAEHVEVGGKFDVSGALTVSDKLEGFGSTEVGGNFESAHVRISGKFISNKMLVKEEADISGKVETKEGLKAKLLIVRSGSQCKGVLIGERVEIGKSSDLTYGSGVVNWATKLAAAGAMAKVDDIYAKQVVIGPNSRAGRIFAETVKLEQGSAVAQVTYNNELRTDSGAAVSEPPQKVVNIPKPPF